MRMGERWQYVTLASRHAQHRPDAECADVAGPGEDLTLISTDIEGEAPACLPVICHVGGQ